MWARCEGRSLARGVGGGHTAAAAGTTRVQGKDNQMGACGARLGPCSNPAVANSGHEDNTVG